MSKQAPPSEKDQQAAAQALLDQKRASYLGYLNTNPEVIDQLARVLSHLHDHRPEDGMQTALRKILGSPADLDTERMALEVEALKQEKVKLEHRKEELHRLIAEEIARKEREAEN